MNRLIAADRSIVVAADVGIDDLHTLAGDLSDAPGIGAFKVGFTAGLDDEGLFGVVSTIRAWSENIPIIYDHQKAGTDILDTGESFARVVKRAGCDAAILFPLAGPETQSAWTKACQDEGLRVIVGGMMTHPRFLASEGGYISDDAPMRIYERAYDDGVRDFVVPGTVERLPHMRRICIFLRGLAREEEIDFYSPGLITQGGSISECGKIAGKRFHSIVGRAITSLDTREARREAVRLYTSQL